MRANRIQAFRFGERLLTDRPTAAADAMTQGLRHTSPPPFETRRSVMVGSYRRVPDDAGNRMVREDPDWGISLTYAVGD